MRILQYRSRGFFGNVVSDPLSLRSRCGDFFGNHPRFFFAKNHVRGEGIDL